MKSHVLLTRYNLPSAGAESVIRAKEGWLRDRTVLFEQYTVPSVQAQTSDHFAWIVYLDPESPSWLVERMASLEQRGVLTPLYRAEVPAPDLVDDIRAVTGRSQGPLITTNLDNDDGLANNFIERLQSSFTPDVRAAVYVDSGLIMAGEALYLRRDPQNAFCSVYEDLTDPLTCWADWHNRLHLHMPVVHLRGAPGWLQVIHGNNVSNRVRGRRVSRSRYEPAFAHLIDQVSAPAPFALTRDALVSWPSRVLRDAGRSAARDAIVRVGGKNGLNTLKDRLARRGPKQ